ncbi:MAG: CRTAC1 family protein [Planctomycetota bacterium]
MSLMGGRVFELRVARPIVVVLVLLCIFACARVDGTIMLRDVTKDTGITFTHTDGSSGRHYIVESVSCGLALFDYDNDGDVDIYFLNGAPLKGTKVKTAPKNALYRNNGSFKFTDVTDKAGAGDTGFGLGVAVGDYDNDGDLDIYANNYGPNVLYRNNGDGTFTDVTAKAGVANGRKVGASAHFLDMDKDGDLDLFVANYLNFTYDNHLMRTSKGIGKYAGPMDFPPMPNDLFRNNGNGTFTDVSVESGVAEHKGWGMGGVCADYDNDGDTDVYIVNDVYANFLFENDGKGKFGEVALIAGLAYDLHGDDQGSMGVACADYDNDGWLDFYQTCYAKELATLYRNLGDRAFEDVTMVTGAGERTFAYVTWGTGMVDFDNDGDRDIFVACGHLEDNVELYDTTATTSAQNVLLMNTGNGKFVDVSDKSGDGMKVELRSRAAAFDDLDNDGDLDVVILNSRRKPTILRNDSRIANHWIQISLRGVKTNRDGVGARVKVVAGDLVQIDEVHSGRSYQSHYGMRLHFGLGKRNLVDRIEVRWIGGGIDVFENIAVDRLVILTEGSSKKIQN